VDIGAARRAGWGIGAARGVSVDVKAVGVDARAACGAGCGAEAARGMCWDAGAACGMATISEVPATKEG
jgi:hypothetical protein